MNKYELLLIFKANFETDALEAQLNKVEGDLKNNGAKLFRTDKVGRKKLAYEIQKTREGLIAVVGFEAEGASIKAIRHALKLNEELLRFTILRNDEMDVTKPFIVTPVTGREPREQRGGGRRGPRPGSGGARPSRFNRDENSQQGEGQNQEQQQASSNEEKQEA